MALIANTVDGKQPPKKSVDQLAQEVLKGVHGNGSARKKSLGNRYNEVQKRVNELLSGKGGTTPKAPSVTPSASKTPSTSTGASVTPSTVSTPSTTTIQTTNKYQQLLDYFKTQNETARKSAIDAIVARVNAQKGAYNTQMNQLGDQYQALRNQSEVERYKTRNALREAQANRGQLDSGYGRQEQLLMDTQYGNAINSINLQEQSARNEIKNLIQQMEAEGEADKTTVNNNYASALQQYIAQLQKDSQQ